MLLANIYQVGTFFFTRGLAISDPKAPRDKPKQATAAICSGHHVRCLVVFTEVVQAGHAELSNLGCARGTHCISYLVAYTAAVEPRTFGCFLCGSISCFRFVFFDLKNE